MRSIVYIILVLSFAVLQCKKDTEPYKSSAHNSYAHNLNPGNSARDFLASTSFKSLKIEIQYMPGFKPDSRAINIFIDLLSERVNKPSGIFVEEKEIDPTLKTSFNLSDISGIESRNRTVFTNGDQMGAYLLFTSGTYYTGNILGLAYKNTSICFFGEPLEIFSGGLTEEDQMRVLALLLTHEFGHLLGLVDMGTPMLVAHLDVYNGNHCDNSDCIMHYCFEPDTRNFARILLDNPSFDINCINDLHANGGK